MTADGLKIAGFDGPVDQGGVFNEMPHPFLLADLKPDVWATDRQGEFAAVGEAKTANDVCNAHTIAQLRLFGNLAKEQSANLCRLYIAVPHSAAHTLDRALIAARLAGAPHVRRLHVPDVLLQSCRHAGR